MKEHSKRYIIQVLSLMAAYMVLLFFSIWLMGQMPMNGWKFLVAVLPVIPLIGVIWNVIRFVKRMDELQRSIYLEAVTFSFLVTSVVTFTYGFLEHAGMPHVSILYVPVLMCFLWGIGAGIASRHYR